MLALGLATTPTSVQWLREGKRGDNLLPPSGQALLPISANGGGDQKDVTSTTSPLSSDANGEAEVSYESLQKMVQGLVKGLDDERKEISVEDATCYCALCQSETADG